MPSTNPNSPKQIQTPVRTLAGGLLIDSTGRVVGRGSTPEDAAQIAEALNSKSSRAAIITALLLIEASANEKAKYYTQIREGRDHPEHERNEDTCRLVAIIARDAYQALPLPEITPTKDTPSNG